jgi:hypothetical protein
MDDLTRAIYRAGCLVAAAHNADAPLELRELVDRANDLYEIFVPEMERQGHMDVQVLPMDPEAERAFLERVRSAANEGKASRDKEKLMRAAAMVDEENMERTDSEENLGARRE